MHAMKPSGTARNAATTPGPLHDRGPAPRIDSEALFDDREMVILVHRGEDYRLRITRNDKLILTK